MTNKRPFAPTILHKLDNYLLLNKPEIWSARTHLVIYYGLLFIIALAGVCFIVPDDPRTSSNIFSWATFVSVICLIAIITWLLFLLRFNVFKRFGNIKPIGRLTTFALYFIAIGTIVSFAFVQPAVECIRANKAYSDAEIIKDVNTINLNICNIEFDSIPKNWDHDTIVIVAEKKYKQYDSYTDNEVVSADVDLATDTVAIMPYVHLPFKEFTAKEFEEKKKNGDSIVKINDTLYKVFDHPDLQTLKIYRAGKHIDSNILNSMELYHAATYAHTGINKIALKKEVQMLVAKYKLPKKETLYRDYSETEYMDKHPSFVQRYSNDYETKLMSSNINDVCSRKAIWDKENWSMLFRIFFYITFVTTLLVFIFRHTTIKAFFLSILVSFIISMLASLITVFTSNKGIPSVLITLLFFALFATIASLVARSKKRNIVVGISINLFVVMVAFIPNTALSLYQEMFFNLTYYERGLRSDFYDKLSTYQSYAEIFGVIILILLLPTYIHWLYRKWFALPQD